MGSLSRLASEGAEQKRLGFSDGGALGFGLAQDLCRLKVLDEAFETFQTNLHECVQHRHSTKIGLNSFVSA